MHFWKSRVTIEWILYRGLVNKNIRNELTLSPMTEIRMTRRAAFGWKTTAVDIFTSIMSFSCKWFIRKQIHEPGKKEDADIFPLWRNKRKLSTKRSQILYAEHIPQSSQYFHGHKLMSKMCADISGVSSPLCRRFLYSASSQSISADSLQLQVYQMAASLRHRNASIPQQPLIWYRT